ncbi:MAG: hypothetical protein C0407_08005 [Desulfobacca sp.]|nr:hypothetical protein [Desulfobacca sp.]
MVAVPLPGHPIKTNHGLAGVKNIRSIDRQTIRCSPRKERYEGVWSREESPPLYSDGTVHPFHFLEYPGLAADPLFFLTLSDNHQIAKEDLP